MQAVIALHDEDAADVCLAHELGRPGHRLIGIQGLRSGAHDVADVVMHWESSVVPWAYRTNVALARREENMYMLHPIVQVATNNALIRTSGRLIAMRMTNSMTNPLTAVHTQGNTRRRRKNVTAA